MQFFEYLQTNRGYAGRYFIVRHLLVNDAFIDCITLTYIQ